MPELPDIAAELGKWDIVSWPIEPGDIVLLHPDVLHGGGSTGENSQRRTLTVRCYGDDVVYAQLSCKGQPGDCVGKFILIDGVGRFAGISGEVHRRVRSPLRALVRGLSSGALVRVATGIAVIKDLKFSTP